MLLYRLDDSRTISPVISAHKITAPNRFLQSCRFFGIIAMHVDCELRSNKPKYLNVREMRIRISMLRNDIVLFIL